MIDWLNNLHPTVNALIVVLGSTTALLTLAAALRSCWRACRKLFRRQPVNPNKVERNKRMLERSEPRFRDAIPPTPPHEHPAANISTSTWSKTEIPFGIDFAQGGDSKVLIEGMKMARKTLQASVQKELEEAFAKNLMSQHTPTYIHMAYEQDRLIPEKKVTLIT